MKIKYLNRSWEQIFSLLSKTSFKLTPHCLFVALHIEQNSNVRRTLLRPLIRLCGCVFCANQCRNKQIFNHSRPLVAFLPCIKNQWDPSYISTVKITTCWFLSSQELVTSITNKMGIIQFNNENWKLDALLKSVKQMYLIQKNHWAIPYIL